MRPTVLLLALFACGDPEDDGLVVDTEQVADTVVVETDAFDTDVACAPAPDVDFDGDGYTGADGDCDDCDPAVNPGAFDFVDTVGVDDDCDEVADPLAPSCDQGLAVASADPTDAARALGLCVDATDRTSGLVDAAWKLPDGSVPPADDDFGLGHGLLAGYGPNTSPPSGERLLALSTGTGRGPGDPGYVSLTGYDKGYTHAWPPGFPKDTPSCPSVTLGQPHDGVALELTLRAPTNATGLSFRWSFFTLDWPSWVCSTSNDVFTAFVSPTPDGLADGNVVFASNGDLVTGSSTLLDACACEGGPPCSAGGLTFDCELGEDVLTGTDATGGTDWVTTTVPVTPGSTLQLRFAIWDSMDGILDSTALIDDVRWLQGDVEVGSAR